MPLRLRDAVASDIAALFQLINSAYVTESGNRGIAFKFTTRFLTPAEVEPLVLSGAVLLCEEEPEEGGQAPLLGCIAAEVQANRCHFGPFAVAPSAQGKGVGKALLAELESRARARGNASLDAEVVNLRLDILPMYLGKLGFRVVGEDSFPAPERTTRGCHFVLIRKSLLL